MQNGGREMTSGNPRTKTRPSLVFILIQCNSPETSSQRQDGGLCGSNRERGENKYVITQCLVYSKSSKV